MVVMVVMVTAYCYGRSTHICPRQKGSFLAIFQYGGRKRSISPPSGCKPRFAGFAVRTRQRRPAGVSAVVCGMAGTQMVRTSVRTGFAGLHPGQTKNGQDRKLNAGAGLQPARWLGCRNRPTSLCARSDASDTAPRNYLYACACACLTESYDNLCPMRQTRRGIRLASRNWTPPGGRSHHPVHPLAGFVVRQHHVQAKFLAQHPGNGSAHGVLLPAGVQHQLETGRALRVA